MTKQEFISLYEKCSSGHCTREEELLLENYQDTFSLVNKWDESELGNEEEIKSEIYTRLIKSIKNSSPVKIYPWLRWVAAACVVFCMLGGLYYFNSISGDTKNRVVIKPKPVPILPGSNKAILILSDGSQVDLGASKNGLVAQQGPSAISKENGRIVYNSNNASAATHLNTIYIPRGGEYELVLPDGSKVWLNSDSKLTFPVVFSGKDRTVELEGEAYFEVAKNKKKPFRVSANGTEVKVLGTSFNVKAYHNEEHVSTTLLEGSVTVANSKQSKMLVPGQQSISYKGRSEIDIAQINAEEAIAWKSGYFIFDNQDIKSIMTIISRWYDVEVEYNLSSNDDRFVGTFSRSVNLSEILKNFELLGKVHFTVKGRRVIVSN
ncbi:FecR domain-containing protein [Pedobacter sp. P351]|uniref:FecR family protein n=1 Tax=Pedobacter superstes TaxID=3133441 RepID=UPI00309CDE8E